MPSQSSTRPYLSGQRRGAAAQHGGLSVAGQCCRASHGVSVLQGCPSTVLSTHGGCSWPAKPPRVKRLPLSMTTAAFSMAGAPQGCRARRKSLRWDKRGLRYETASKMEQFLTRFLLRETMHQLQSLQASLECAVDTVEEQAGRERKEIKKSETSVGLRSGRRCGRRGQKNVCLSPTDPYSGMLTTGVCVEDSSQWMAQINRLQQLIEKLECKSPRLEPLKEEAMCKGQDAHILVAKRQISVATSSVEEFRQAFRSYTEGTAGHSSCLHVSACKLTDEACFILYEFWRDVTSWRSHLQSSCSKTFQQSILSLLESPELLTTMLFPGLGVSWGLSPAQGCSPVGTARSRDTARVADELSPVPHTPGASFCVSPEP
ncbi:N-terminal EF-hand calcium-binding protein 3 isoform X3 [Vidua chalybeata]|uniref:N-terminal EF-hand calcium-binding protein 3 isoform X3 n=1 Tax=Vidua chalybeata TaxID=81927 RepID=UPI0023A8CC26|nr:N-terminal EF-hand calcium-binding protein 3 isoform X3 [Vidua chalybeata]